MKGAELFVRCLENEGVEMIFGLPGEENIHVMDALLDSKIRFITTRHEQGAAFMADVYGRLTGKAGVCLATLGPGATNLITGVADANMDRAPLVAIAGQADTRRMHKESHQHLPLCDMFRPITKYAAQALNPDVIPEIVRKAFKVAEAEKPGACFIELPEDVAEAQTDHDGPLTVQRAMTPEPPMAKIRQIAELIADAKHPIIMAGNGVIRSGASDALVAFAEVLNIPVATTFMGKGAIPFSHDLSLGTIGMQAHDFVACGFDRADLVICIGYDIVEYHPRLWHPTKNKKIVHIDVTPAEVDEHYILASGIEGNISTSLRAISQVAPRKEGQSIDTLRDVIRTELSSHADSRAFPLKPQKIVWDLRQVLDAEDIVISDVGAHKMWMARMYQAERPNTCIISNGFASMAISIPGAIAAKLAHPDRAAIAVCGDAGFMMNCQEIETAMRLKTPIVILVWTDGEYGLIRWHQERTFGRSSNISFNNPDFMKFAESFGAKGYRIESPDDLQPTIRKAIEDNTVVIIDCPVDYSENMKLTEQLGQLVCPV